MKSNTETGRGRIAIRRPYVVLLVLVFAAVISAPGIGRFELFSYLFSILFCSYVALCIDGMTRHNSLFGRLGCSPLRVLIVGCILPVITMGTTAVAYAWWDSQRSFNDRNPIYGAIETRDIELVKQMLDGGVDSIGVPTNLPRDAQ